MAGNQYHSEVGEYFIRCRHLGCPIDAHVVEGYIYSCSASIFLFFCCCCCWHSYSSSCIQMIAGCIHTSDLDVAQNNNELPWCCHFWLLTQIQCISQIISKPNKTNGSGLTLPDPNSIHVLCPFWGRSPWRWCHCWGAFFPGQLLWDLLIWG